MDQPPMEIQDDAGAGLRLAVIGNVCAAAAVAVGLWYFVWSRRLTPSDVTDIRGFIRFLVLCLAFGASAVPAVVGFLLVRDDRVPKLAKRCAMGLAASGPLLVLLSAATGPQPEHWVGP